MLLKISKITIHLALTGLTKIMAGDSTTGIMEGKGDRQVREESLCATQTSG